MILVDTSGLIKVFKGVDAHKIHWLEKLILAEEEVCISDHILTEVLQGFARDKDFELARQHLRHFPFYSLRNINSNIPTSADSWIWDFFDAGGQGNECFRTECSSWGK
jgi:hypothetical protein